MACSENYSPCPLEIHIKDFKAAVIRWLRFALSPEASLGMVLPVDLGEVHGDS